MRNAKEELKKMLEDSLWAHKEVKENVSDGAYYRWLNKKVLDSKLIYNGDTLDNVIANACLDISIDNNVYLNGSSSLKIYNKTTVENVIPRPWPSVKINVEEFDLSKYNRAVANVYIKAEGYQNFYIHFNVSSKENPAATAMSVETNKWVKLVWEIDDLKRSSCSSVSVSPWLMGCPDEALPDYELFIDSFYVEKVEADYVSGWSTEKRIAYSHVGYFKNSQKLAFTSEHISDNFTLINEKGNKVLEDKVVEIQTELGKYYVADFSKIKKEGVYQLILNEDNKTESFLISDDAYESSVWKSMNFLRLLRCGEDIEGVHSACHLNVRCVHENGSSVAVFGGWHDAGDVSQFEIPTAEMAHAIIDLAFAYKDKNRLLYERLKEEARVGINWLLRTRFEDGSRACAVGYNYWRKSVLEEDNKTIYNNKAENGPFENFCACAAEAKAYLLYKDEDIVFASWCLRAAKEDFEFARDGYRLGIHTKRWGSNCDSQVAGHGALAAAELYRCTSESYYLEEGAKYGKIICKCQEQGSLDWEKPLKGFFYEDPKHERMLSYEHRGHEQSPIQGLVNLCEVDPNNKDYKKWLKAIKLYRKFILDTIKYTAPYNLLPGHVYIKGKINLERFTFHTLKDPVLQEEEVWNQAKNGIKLNNDAYLRIFPAAPDRRGFHATVLSKTKAVSEIAKLLNDKLLKQICIDQMEWVLGKNPFASSTMFGEGHNYHPLYVAFSRQMVGALPVGIMAKGYDDIPYWPTRDNSVYKEIWGHTTGKYLWVLADLIR